MNIHTHTQGPWHIGVRQPTSGKFIYGPQGEEIADCDRQTNFNDENLANARLISTAPDLLATLRNLLSEYLLQDPDGGHVCALTLEQARAAIAKAEGGGNS